MKKMGFKNGLVHVITGCGPGKTTSAIGRGIRAVGYGYNVCMIQFMKSGKIPSEKPPQNLGETSFLKKTNNFTIASFGTEGFVKKEHVILAKKGIHHLKKELIKRGMDNLETLKIAKKTEKDVNLAEKALEYAKSVIKERKYDVIILDEINLALDYGLVDKQKIINLIQNKPAHVELILTGRYAPPEIVNIADYVVMISEIKHPFQEIKMIGRKGIEF